MANIKSQIKRILTNEKATLRNRAVKSELKTAVREAKKAIAAGDCDLGLSNHYYLGRILKDDPTFPVAPAWPDQDGAGAHTNVSGVGVVAGTDMADEAQQLVEYMTGVEAEELALAEAAVEVVARAGGDGVGQ